VHDMNESDNTDARGISVDVTTLYVDSESEPENNRYVLMITDDGDEFKAPIADFLLTTPRTLH